MGRPNSAGMPPMAGRWPRAWVRSPTPASRFRRNGFAPPTIPAGIDADFDVVSNPEFLREGRDGRLIASRVCQREQGRDRHLLVARAANS